VNLDKINSYLNASNSCDNLSLIAQHKLFVFPLTKLFEESVNALMGNTNTLNDFLLRNYEG